MHICWFPHTDVVWANKAMFRWLWPRKAGLKRPAMRWMSIALVSPQKQTGAAMAVLGLLKHWRTLKIWPVWWIQIKQAYNLLMKHDILGYPIRDNTKAFPLRNIYIYIYIDVDLARSRASRVVFIKAPIVEFCHTSLGHVHIFMELPLSILTLW